MSGDMEQVMSGDSGTAGVRRQLKQVCQETFGTGGVGRQLRQVMFGDSWER